jgi:4-amino-4-deoxychorismate lyase
VKIHLNGTIIDEEKAVVSVYDHGFLYGIGLFETFRCYRGQPFLLEEHRRRLEAGCDQLGMSYKPRLKNWVRIIDELLLANSLQNHDAYIRFTVTAGREALGLPAGEYEKPTVVVYMKPLPPTHPQAFEQGKALQLLKLPRNTPEGPVRLKSLHYMNNILARRELCRYPWAEGAEGLLTDANGHAAEGIVSNLFIVKRGCILTPSLTTGILPGVTRAFVMRLAQRQGFTVEEGLYGWDEVLGADEVFMTNSIQELVPVTKLFDPTGKQTILSQGAAGEVTRKLKQLYEAYTLPGNEG